jgi:hypothetical protein
MLHRVNNCIQFIVLSTRFVVINLITAVFSDSVILLRALINEGSLQ